MATAIFARLREEFPEAYIIAETQHSEVFRGNPNINFISPTGFAPRPPGCTFHDLDMVYERSPGVHAIDAYSKEVFGDFTREYRHRKTFLEFPKVMGTKNLAMVHAAQSWPSRTLPRAFWDRLALALRTQGFKVVFIGHGGDYGGPGVPGIESHVGRYDIHSLAGEMDVAAVVIGTDSACLHIAGTTSVPIIGLYTCVKGDYRKPMREGIPMRVFGAPIECYGCLETVAAPVTNYSCKRGDNACVMLFNPEAVAATAYDIAFNDGRLFG